MTAHCCCKVGDQNLTSALAAVAQLLLQEQNKRVIKCNPVIACHSALML